jgi:hypothetical protein
LYALALGQSTLVSGLAIFFLAACSPDLRGSMGGLARTATTLPQDDKHMGHINGYRNTIIVPNPFTCHNEVSP